MESKIKPLIPEGACFHKDCQLFGKSLPFEEFAIVIPLELINTTVIVHSPDCRSSLWLDEFFVPQEIWHWQSLVEPEAAYTDEILGQCLNKYFSLSRGETLWALPLSSINSRALFVCKASEMARPNDLRDILEDAMQASSIGLVNLLLELLSYERLVVKTMIENRLPCLLTNGKGQIIAANCAFKDLADVQTIEPMTELSQIIAVDQQTNLLSQMGDQEWRGIASVYFRNTGRVFESTISISPLDSPIGRRFLWILSDIPFSRIQIGANAILLERLTSIAAKAKQPETALRSIINMVAASFQADIVSLLKESDRERLVVTPYSNRKLDLMGVTMLTSQNQPELKAYFETNQPLFYPDVSYVSGPSIIKSKLDAQQFALVPLTTPNSQYALLVIWQTRTPGIDLRVLTVLKTIGNIIGTTLSTIEIQTEAEREKQRIQRYARVTAGREIQMARLKKQNAELQAILAEISRSRKEQPYG